MSVDTRGLEVKKKSSGCGSVVGSLCKSWSHHIQGLRLPLEGTLWTSVWKHQEGQVQARQCRHPKAENRRKIPPTLPNRRPCGHVCSSLLENEEMQTNLSGLNGPCPRQLGPPDLCRKQRHTRQGKHGLIQHLLKSIFPYKIE